MGEAPAHDYAEPAQDAKIQAPRAETKELREFLDVARKHIDVDGEVAALDAQVQNLLAERQAAKPMDARLASAQEKVGMDSVADAGECRCPRVIVEATVPSHVISVPAEQADPWPQSHLALAVACVRHV